MTAAEDPDSAIEVVVRMGSKDRKGCGPPTQPLGATASPQMRVARADNGFEVPLNELMRAGEQPLLWSVDERMRLIRRRVRGRVVIRSREVFRVSLASGRQLELTSGQRV